MADPSIPRRSPPWHRDEIILALDLYVQAGSLGGGALPYRTDPAVIDASRQMNALPIWRQSERAATFRNPAGVALKLANFRAVERAVGLESGAAGAEALPRGMQSFSVLDRLVFEEFQGRWRELRWEAEAIWSSAGFVAGDVASEEGAGYDTAADAPIDGGGASEYEASAGPGGRRSRTESELVVSYSEYMAARGHEVVGRHYQTHAESRRLRADLMVRDLNVLVEAKATDARHAVRMAIGQLYDYRRFEPSQPNLAVLVPKEPVTDLRGLLHGLDIAYVWPRGHGFRDSVDGQLVS